MARQVLIENVELALSDLVKDAMKTAFPQLADNLPKPLVTQGRKTEYQCNNAMGLAKQLSTLKPPVKMSPKDIGVELAKAIPANDLLQECEPTDQGFINITVSNKWACNAVKRVLIRGIQPPDVPREKVVVDFSSPNIAKDMHVGHLRSTIIGECLCRAFEWSGHQVSRINHVGDWGTQFGMLILYLKQQHPDFLTVPPPIKDLVEFYKLSKKCFDESPEFKDQARLEVVKLQSLEEESIKAWKLICDLSRKEFQEIYDRLNITLEERGESFYNPIIPEVIKMLEPQVTDSDGAKIIVSKEEKPSNELTDKHVAKLFQQFITSKRDGTVEILEPLVELLKEINVITTDASGVEVVALGKKETKPWAKFDAQKDVDKLAKAAEKLYKPALNAKLAAKLEELNLKKGDIVQVPRFAFPLMVLKSDGGYTYDTTDLACIYHRTQVEKNQRIVYVTDAGQFEHFRMVCQSAEDMGWLKEARWQHAGFGLVSGEDGKKLKTRSGDTVKLRDLLDEAKDRSYATLVEREQTDSKQGHTEEEMRRLSAIIGYGAVKYFDLKQNRTTDYTFSFDKMLDMNGNTAVFLLYSYARIMSLKRKAETTTEQLQAAIAVDGAEIILETDVEKQLALTAFKFSSVVERTLEELMPNKITEFAYGLVCKFSDFYQECRVVGHPQQTSRLLLAELTGNTLKAALAILGIEVADKL